MRCLYRLQLSKVLTVSFLPLLALWARAGDSGIEINIVKELLNCKADEVSLLVIQDREKNLSAEIDFPPVAGEKVGKHLSAPVLIREGSVIEIVTREGHDPSIRLEMVKDRAYDALEINPGGSHYLVNCKAGKEILDLMGAESNSVNH